MSKPIQPKPTPASKDTAAYLKRITSNDSHILNIRDFSHQTPLGLEVLAHISPSFSASVDNIPHKLNWLQLNDVWRSWYEADERLEFTLTKCEADVDEEAGEATVFMEMDVVGLSNVALTAFSEVRWRREEGKWMIWGFWGCRGCPGNDGLFG